MTNGPPKRSKSILGPVLREPTLHFALLAALLFAGSAVFRSSADEEEIRSSILNLVLNSFDAMPEGGTLTLTLGVAGENIVVEVDPANSRPTACGEFPATIKEPESPPSDMAPATNWPSMMTAAIWVAWVVTLFTRGRSLAPSA